LFKIRNESGTIIFQGDIVLTKAQEAEIFSNTTQKGKKAFGNLWTDGVTYKFDQYGSAENVLLVSEGDQGGYDGCLSYLGKSQNSQMLFLGRSCQTYGQAAHAIGHTLGLYHTLDREDRDIYVNITMMPEIKKYDDRYREAIKESNNNYGLPFDFGSVMNYRIPFDDTIMMINRRYYEQTLGSPMISFVDLSIINERYGCKEKCKSESSAKCVNGGFPHPRDCRKCICPGGYGGALCDKNTNSPLYLKNTQSNTLTPTVNQISTFLMND
ncbi:astacin, partial [Oesophagostomum dentatum]